MLTTTYSLVVLSSEQQNARRILRKLEQRLRKGAAGKQGAVDPVWLDMVFNEILHIDRYCHERKIELYVIPVLRRLSADADAVLAKLDSLSADSVRLLRYACEQAQRVFDGMKVDAAALISAIQLYCTQVLERLSLEEAELLPAARRLLSQEEWFRIAALLLSEARPARAPRRPHAFSSFPCGQRQLLRNAH